MSELKITAQTTFDVNGMLSAEQKASKKFLYKFGAYTRQIARRSIKKGEQVERSPPGAPPVGHDEELYKNFIEFGVGVNSVSIGALLTKSNQAELVPETIEYGGVVELFEKDPKTGKTVRVVREVEARPAMRLAFQTAAEKKIPELLEGSIANEV